MSLTSIVPQPPAPEPVRHPEKAARPDQPSPRKPPWIRVKAPTSPEYQATRRLMRELKLNTVCEEAACPNIGECWKEKHATMMILGAVCTRACTFCNVATGRPDLVDPHEPQRVADAVAKLGSSTSSLLRLTATIFTTAAPNISTARSPPSAL